MLNNLEKDDDSRQAVSVVFYCGTCISGLVEKYCILIIKVL